MSTISYLLKKHPKTLLKLTYLLFYEGKDLFSKPDDLSHYPREHVKHLKVLLDIFRNKNGYKEKIKQAMEITRDDERMKRREMQKNDQKKNKFKEHRKKNKNIQKNTLYLEKEIKCENSFDSDSVFAHFHLIDPPRHPLYQALTRHTRALRPVLYQQMERCMICGEVSDMFKRHVIKCLKTNQTEVNWTGTTIENKTTGNETARTEAVENKTSRIGREGIINIDLTKHDKEPHDISTVSLTNSQGSIKLVISIPSIEVSTFYTSKTLVSDIKTEISDHLNIAKSKLHVFDGERPLKNGEIAGGTQLTVRYKKR